MFEIETSITFEAAHLVAGHPKCGNLHGHTWTLTVCLMGSNIGLASDYAYLVDFGEVKAILRELAPDHKYLNDVYSFSPTSEELARHFYSQIRGRMQSLGLDRFAELAWVQVSEGLNNHARFYISPTDRIDLLKLRQADGTAPSPYDASTPR